MSTEHIPLQYDMFTGERVDTRSAHQKRLDAERHIPKQTMMFSLHELEATGRQVRPWLRAMPRPVMVLEREEARTPEEIETDLLEEARTLTTPMFGEESSPPLQRSTAVTEDNALIDDSLPIDYRVPVLHLGKNELLEQCPEFKQRIRTLSDSEIETLALQVEEALKPIYNMVLKVALAAFVTADTGARRSEQEYSHVA